MGLGMDLKIVYRERKYLPKLFNTNESDLSGGKLDEAKIITSNIPSFVRLMAQSILGVPSKRACSPIKIGGEDTPDERWFFINGICTNKEVLELNGKLLSQLFKRPIYCLHNPTNGINIDLVECIAGRTLDISEPITRNLAYFVEEALGKNCNVRIIAHSQGGIIVANMIKYLHIKGLPLKKLEVFTFASASDGEFEVNGLFQEHYANEEDFVARIGLQAPEFKPKNLYIRSGGQGHLLNRNYLNAFARGEFGTEGRLYGYLKKEYGTGD
jgi:hypothetical protein